MPGGANGNFAAMLDDLLAQHGVQDGSAARAPAVDYLSAMDELHSGRITIGLEAAATEYGSNLVDLFDAAAGTHPAEPERIEPEPELPTDQGSIELELGLAGGRLPDDLDGLRRSFALRNHPDRVDAGQRDRAMVRMQIANMLIDDAKRRALNAAGQARSGRA